MTRAAWSEIHLPSLKHNLARVRQQAPNSRVMAVIKANGYGHGLLRVAKALEGADAYAVASVDEALRLRDANIRKPVVLLSGFLDASELMLVAEQQLQPVIHHPQQLELLESVVVARPMKVWLKLDSGMHRLGFAADDFAQAWRRLDALDQVEEVALMTHFSSADERDNSCTVAQVGLFNRVVSTLPEVADSADKSLANSAGILGWPESHGDWVRPGLMLYGVSPFGDCEATDLGLKPVLSFKTRLISVKTLSEGDSVGYGGSFTASREMVMGVCAAGYGDGYPRHVKAGTVVLVNDNVAEVIGRVSMDLICLDLTGLKEVNVGDEVTLWGQSLPVERVAIQAGTIPYELLCQMTARVRVREV